MGAEMQNVVMFFLSFFSIFLIFYSTYDVSTYMIFITSIYLHIEVITFFTDINILAGVTLFFLE